MSNELMTDEMHGVNNCRNRRVDTSSDDTESEEDELVHIFTNHGSQRSVSGIQHNDNVATFYDDEEFVLQPPLSTRSQPSSSLTHDVLALPSTNARWFLSPLSSNYNRFELRDASSRPDPHPRESSRSVSSGEDRLGNTHSLGVAASEGDANTPHSPSRTAYHRRTPGNNAGMLSPLPPRGQEVASLSSPPSQQVMWASPTAVAQLDRVVLLSNSLLDSNASPFSSARRQAM